MSLNGHKKDFKIVPIQQIAKFAKPPKMLNFTHG